jgi:hypothetical protein
MIRQSWKRISLSFLLSLAIVVLVGLEPVGAQPPGGGGGGPCPFPPCNPDVPITGIEFLLGGGALLGVRHLWAKAKSSLKK